ncbi:hypothetical protein CPB84DRAFT_1852271 [Gymnopilus junonius]|uniref:Fungal-type protein kinase domain-containing protein n=1 Tax=Gymnopilus junonius TaxID=109634 RepID=A0A9P5TGQ1_GYMJU|nr:hypothetical protein CPB84DRAFT_1852271 [Gymnopilus junonius]
MFEAQPFCRFAIGLALHGRSTDSKLPQFCFVLVDRAGVCLTNWANISGYEAITLTCIVFRLSYTSPDVLSIDTSMTVDFYSGNISKIKVQDQEFDVVKHIYSSLILFGHGTHVFLVRDKARGFHILKDAWILADHKTSEIDILSTISDNLKKDLMTGPAGDTVTSFRSREEFVKVILDCVDWLEYLHKKCQMVHGDLSINNIVIYRNPLPHPPISLRKGAKWLPASASVQMTQHKSAAFMLAPSEGLKEKIPVSGVVIDYDYAREISKGTGKEKTSGTLPFMLLASLGKGKHGKHVYGPAHDLESLLHMVIGIVTFTIGPCGQLRLHKDKAIDLINYGMEIHEYLPDYWKPFSPYVRHLVSATWPNSDPFSESAATHEAYREILKEALTDLGAHHPETECSYARVIVPAKHPRSSADVGKYPYKFLQGDDAKRHPQIAVVKPLSEWKDSVDI